MAGRFASLCIGTSGRDSFPMGNNAWRKPACFLNGGIDGFPDDIQIRNLSFWNHFLHILLTYVLS